MSFKHPALAPLALGYAPLYDKQRQVLATRLSCIPLKPDVQVDTAGLLAVLQEALPGKPLVLNVPQEAALTELLDAALPGTVALEVPAFLAGGLATRLTATKGHLLSGKVSTPLGPERAAFKAAEWSLDELRQGVQDPNKLTPWCTGVHAATEANEAFERGAQAAFGLPVEGPYEPPPGATVKAEVSSDLQVIIILMGQVDQGESTEKMEATLKRDPGLAFKLLRYMNSAAFGLPVEVTSFRHALMLLGLNRLKRWLALLLATASKDATMRPVMWAALRRGLLMEELAKTLQDSDAKDEMFICGLFSLLDHLLKTPFKKLLESIPCPERVRQALVDETGPYQPYLQLVRAIESESAFDYRDAAETLMISPAELNAAILQALNKAMQLE
ncbi:EAL and HDOD domain-containing protein [Inhella gelatinilytica]|uniref:HDOD domain-containing protein n=1 Tax=Inhella gelatinilytica TaxID=2795030 RepID=A0A931NET5_9BURK|nr:HDOD domain-containing protein [Inhella gelatinilytica]MBH9553550.1 HDOD domain-containing protein [Inhella gelatinilytica]